MPIQRRAGSARPPRTGQPSSACGAIDLIGPSGRGATGPPGRDVPLTLLARILLAVAFAAQVYNALHLPTFRDYDAPGHALNAYALHRGEMPDPSSWSGFHPPLAYAIGALAWRLGD